MAIVKRPFSGEADKGRMAALACQFSNDNLHVIDLPYRFSSWAFDDPGNISLWLDKNQRLVGWAVLQTPFWTIDFAYHPEADPGLHRQILKWADQRSAALVNGAYGRPAWFVNTFADQANRMRDLEEAGFACQVDAGEDAWSKVFMQLLAQPEAIEWPVPAGFSIRSLRGEGEVEAYVDLQRSVFGSKNMTVEWRSRTLRHPDYVADLDLVAEAPDGSLAAFCIGWLNRYTNQGVTGQIEPMGVHENYRKIGLGRIILSEALRRLQLHGASQIFVETDNYRNAALELYEATGFRVIKDVLVYRRDYVET